MAFRKNGAIFMIDNTILVLGAGAWGTTIADLLAQNNKKIKILLWAFEKEVADQINKNKINNTYLPEISLNKNIIATKKYLGEYAKYVFVVVPSQHAFHIVKKYSIFFSF